MHAYVDHVSKLDAPSKKHSTNGQAALDEEYHSSTSNINLNHSVDKMMNKSQNQQIECISELDSENEFSYIKNVNDDEEFKNDDFPIQQDVMHIKRVSRQVTSKEPEVAIEKRKKITDASPMVALGSSRKNEGV